VRKVDELVPGHSLEASSSARRVVGLGERKGDPCRRVRRVLPTGAMIDGRIRRGGEVDDGIQIRQGGEADDGIQRGGGADRGIRRQRRGPGFNGEERSAAARSGERVAAALAWRGVGSARPPGGAAVLG
jgi:hypothetical protein